MGGYLGSLMATLESKAGWLLASGLLAALVVNFRQWRQDQRKARSWRSHNPGAPRLEEGPLVSILLPAWNEARNIAACIDSLLALRYANKEIIVCTGGSDGTLEIARRYTGTGVVVFEQQPGDGKQGALQRCFEQSDGKIIFLTDADCILDNAAFEATLSPVVQHGESVASGAWRPVDCQISHPFVQFQWSHHVYRQVITPDYADTLDGRNAAIRRSALEKIGAFKTFAPVGTDYVLSRQLAAAGYRVRFIRESQVRTWYPETFSGYRRQISRWYRNPLVMARAWGERPLRVTHLRAGIFSLAMLTGPIVALLGSKLVLFAWTVGLFHLLLKQVRHTYLLAACTGIKPRQARWSACIPVYLLFSWISMASGLLEGLLPHGRMRW